VPSDPNDPNSPEKEEVTSFAEVAQLIADELTDKLIYAKADEIMQQARVLSEIKIFEEGLEPETMTSKQFEKCASDYNEIAEQIRQDYNLKVYVGKTGMLSPGVMDQDKYLATMTLAGYGYYPVRLAHAVFAIDELKLGELGVFDTAKPRMFENIGPARDILAPYLSKLKDPSRQICAIVRIIKAEKSRAPESIDESFKTHSFVMDANDKSDEDIYSVRKLVAEDVKKLGMMETTKSKAGEFIKLTKAEGWDKAIEKFNELYPIDANEIIKDPNAASFTMETLTGLRRSTEWKIQTLAAQNSGYPTVSLVLQRAELERIFADKLYNLLPTDSSSVSELEEPFEFKPSMCYFCVKDLSVDRLWKENFNINRPLQAYSLDTIQTQSLSIVHLNPSNIEKRMKFKWAQRDEDTSDSNTPDANMADVSAFDTSVPEADAQDNEPMDSNAAGRAEGQM